MPMRKLRNAPQGRAPKTLARLIANFFVASI